MYPPCSLSVPNNVLFPFQRRGFCLICIGICKNRANSLKCRTARCFKKCRTNRSPMTKRLASIGKNHFQDENTTGGEKTSRRQFEHIRGGLLDVFFQQTWLFVNALNLSPFPTSTVPAPARSFPRTRIDSPVRLSFWRGTSPGQLAQSTHPAQWHRQDTTQCPHWP